MLGEEGRIEEVLGYNLGEGLEYIEGVVLGYIEGVVGLDKILAEDVAILVGALAVGVLEAEASAVGSVAAELSLVEPLAGIEDLALGFLVEAGMRDSSLSYRLSRGHCRVPAW